MRHRISIVLAAAFLGLILWPAASSAELSRTTVELNANHETVEGRLQFESPLLQNTLFTGYNAIYKDDEYRLMGLDFLLGDRVRPDLLVALGFRGVYGKVTALSEEPYLSCIGFMARGEYTLPVELPFPLVLGGQLNYSPQPLSFDDTEDYWSFRAHFDINVLQTGGITLGYRYHDMDFGQSYTEDSFFLGFKLSF